MTINGLLASAQSGDVVELDAGTYVENLDNTIPSGVTLKAKTGATVIIKPASGARVVYVSSKSNITLDGLILDATNCEFNGLKVDYVSSGITVINCEIKNAVNQGVLLAGATVTDVTLSRCHIHHHGSNIQLQHGLYIGAGDGILVEHCEIDHNASHGIHMFGGEMGHTWRLEGNYCHHNYTGIGAYYGRGTIINNVLRANANVNLALRYDLEAADVWHNSLIGHASQGAIVGYFNFNDTEIDLANNIIIAGTYGLVIDNPADAVDETITVRKMLISGQIVDDLLQNGDQAGVTLDIISSVFTPLVDDGAASYKPAVGNPAIGAGVELGVTTDYHLKPRVAPSTIGAFDIAIDIYRLPGTRDVRRAKVRQDSKSEG